MNFSNLNQTATDSAIEKKKMVSRETPDENLATTAEKNLQTVGTQIELSSAVGESAENSESAESFEGGRQQKKDSQFRAKKSDQKAAAQISAALQSSSGEVSPEVVRTVKIALDKEITNVKRAVKKLSRNSQKNAFELSVAYSRLKKLKFILKNLAHWAADFFKTLLFWIRSKKPLSEVPLPMESWTRKN